MLLYCLINFPHSVYNAKMSLSCVVRLVYFSTTPSDKIIHNWHFFFSFLSETFTFLRFSFKSRFCSFGFPILIHRKQVWFSTGKYGINSWKSIDVQGKFDFPHNPQGLLLILLNSFFQFFLSRGRG